MRIWFVMTKSHSCNAIRLDSECVDIISLAICGVESRAAPPDMVMNTRRVRIEQPIIKDGTFNGKYYDIFILELLHFGISHYGDAYITDVFIEHAFIPYIGQEIFVHCVCFGRK